MWLSLQLCRRRRRECRPGSNRLLSAEGCEGVVGDGRIVSDSSRRVWLIQGLICVINKRYAPNVDGCMSQRATEILATWYIGNHAENIGSSTM